MKIRLDFVTNSSSSSFICYAIYDKALYDYLKELFENQKLKFRDDYNGYLTYHWAWEELRFVNEKNHAIEIVDQNIHPNEKSSNGAFSAIKKFLELLNADECEKVKTLISKAFEKGFVDYKSFIDSTDSYTDGFSFDGNPSLKVYEKLYNRDYKSLLHYDNPTDVSIDCEYIKRHKVKEIIIPEGVESVSFINYYYPYKPNVDSVRKIEFSSSVKNTDVIFRIFKNLKEVVLSDDLKKINNDAFYDCYELELVYIGKNTTTIGKFAFYNCKSLEKIHLPESIKKIEENAFLDCRNLNEINFPSQLEDIKFGAFRNCFRLSEIVIPSSVKYIGAHAFEHCSGINSIIIPNGITEIADGLFEDCFKLKKIKLPSTIKTIGKNAFRGCKQLNNVEVLEGVEVIAREAFANCSALDSLTLPSSLKLIETPFAEHNNKNGKPVKIYASKDSYAEKFAHNEGFAFCNLEEKEFELDDKIQIKDPNKKVLFELTRKMRKDANGQKYSSLDELEKAFDYLDLDKIIPLIKKTYHITPNLFFEIARLLND